MDNGATQRTRASESSEGSWKAKRMAGCCCLQTMERQCYTVFCCDDGRYGDGGDGDGDGSNVLHAYMEVVVCSTEFIDPRHQNNSEA